MTFPPTSSERMLSIYLALGQYPILSTRILARMHTELLTRGVVQPGEFEAEVKEKAILSQELEGLVQPIVNEPPETWELRMNRVRDQMITLYFSQHLPYTLFEEIVRGVLQERGISPIDQVLSVNPELAPQELVFQQGLTIENMPPEQRGKMDARLQEAKVVLIRTIISDQLRYINVAKEWFTVADLANIRRRKIGSGRIGGKAAGMLLAARIIHQQQIETILHACVQTPDSYFIGSDEMYNFMSINNLVHWNDQKYKTEQEMRDEYPQIEDDFVAGSFSPDILQQFETMLANVGGQPLIVRSSSLLEDNFGTSFAGKYQSIFCPNQGDAHQNLVELTQAIARIYASTLNPSALLYRRSRGLQDYDERMAILIQVVRGERFDDFYLPHGAGVAFSRNLYRWTPQIRRDDGFLRLVWGLGTRAVDRVGNDYPRLIALSHPLLRPNTNPKLVQRYSQQYVDLIDLKENKFKTLPVRDVLQGHYPPLRYVAQVYEAEGYFTSLRSNIFHSEEGHLVLTFEELLKRTNFAELMRTILQILERSYRSPVDMEFTMHIDTEALPKPTFCIDILQCRPQSHLFATEQVPLPNNLPAEKLVFSTNFIVPQGCIQRVEYFLFVPPEAYFQLSTNTERYGLARSVGKVNAAMAKESFVCVGPGRWGSTNPDLGVPIEYGDIYNTKSLVEVTGAGIGMTVPPEPSLGTHFFQDLLESQIFPLAIYLDDPNSDFNRKFFYDMPNHLSDWIPADEALEKTLRIVRVKDYLPDHHVTIVMNDDKSVAIAYLEKDSD